MASSLFLPGLAVPPRSPQESRPLKQREVATSLAAFPLPHRDAYPVVHKYRLLISMSIGPHSYESACEGNVDSYVGIRR